MVTELAGYLQTTCCDCRCGCRSLINHLTSESGKKHNLKECLVVGRDPIEPQDFLNKRLHVRIIDPETDQPSGAPVRIRRQNLVPLMPNNNPNPGVLYGSMPRPPWKSQTRMSDAQTLKLLRKAYEEALEDGDGEPPGVSYSLCVLHC